ncbi:bridging integrator 2a isoform X1 [Tachysurus fulvidraco]|uniref:bridging integrator 2a isoform X1 n=2 Tax=Tachysurus fulvidraco TaxID=1234273 RepID=UPI001FEDBBBB|nr:bridging integrator 2a isoform X1 [Tachysurus fulvidraco]
MIPGGPFRAWFGMLTEYFTQEPMLQLGPKFKEFQRAHIFEGEGRAHEVLVLKGWNNWSCSNKELTGVEKSVKIMAERKNSTSPNLQSKGGAGKFAKQVQRKFSRAQEKVLQTFSKSEETRDAQFELYVQNFQDQQSDGHRIYKDLKAYLNAVRVMRDASSRLFQSLFDVYELEWEGGEDLGAVVEGEDLLWNDYEAKLRDQALLTIESYMSQFPDMRVIAHFYTHISTYHSLYLSLQFLPCQCIFCVHQERVAKRGRKRVDYDSTRHHLESLQNAKKRDDIKINKAEEEMKMTKTIFEDMNTELKDELPLLYDSRIGCYVTVFQAISDLRDIFYKEMSQNNKDLQNIMINLKSQHPVKSFVVKTFSRGTLKRRSLKDALSPRSMRASFSELHLTYSSRGTLRRGQSSSFRSDKGKCEPYIPEVLASPARPKPPMNSDCGISDTDASSPNEHNTEVERTASTAHVPLLDGTETSGSVHSTTNIDAKEENEGTETKESNSLPASEQDGERMSLEIKGDSFSETGDENKQDLNINYSEKVNTKVLSFIENLEEHRTHSEELNEPESGMENKCL